MAEKELMDEYRRDVRELERLADLLPGLSADGSPVDRSVKSTHDADASSASTAAGAAGGALSSLS